jgi:hypothetical protein
MLAHVGEAGKWRNKAVVKKSVINTISPLFPVSDWPIIMIRPGGLLLVVSHLFAVSVSFVWVRLQEKVNKTWMREIFLQGSHSEHHWGSCSTTCCTFC